MNKPGPARLEPVLIPRIWGTRSLAPLFPDIACSEPIGEVWLTGNQCRLVGSAFHGRKLGDAWPEMPREWTGSRVPNDGPFPLLVKFLFSEDRLSIQVHPDDDYARRNEAAAGGVGKTEMWYAVSAKPGAEVRVGLKPGVTPSSLRRAMADGTVEECLERAPVRAGDAIFVPAGTAHTIGPGLVLCEIQENSDLTYRIFDYHRATSEGQPRPLHIEKALEVLRFGEQRGGRIEPVAVGRGPLKESWFVACPYFATEKWEFEERVTAATSPERFELLVVLAGKGRIEAGGDAADYRPAEVWILPAALGRYQLEPHRATTLLRTYVPDLDQFAQRLADQHIPQSARARLVYP